MLDHTITPFNYKVTYHLKQSVLQKAIDFYHPNVFHSNIKYEISKGKDIEKYFLLVFFSNIYRCIL